MERIHVFGLDCMLRLNFPISGKAVDAIRNVCLALVADAGEPLYLYVLRVALVNVVLSCLLAAFVQLCRMDLSDPPFSATYSPLRKAATAFLILIISPIVETYIMVRLIRLAGLIFDGRLIGSIVSAIVFAMLHSMLRPAWGIVVFPAFLSMSFSYFTLANRFGGKKAVLSVAAMHSLQNVPGAISFAFSGV